MLEPIKIDGSGPKIEDDRIPAFIVTHDDAEDEVYTVPKDIDGGTALLAIEVMVTRGEDAAVLWLARHALGSDGMHAVLNTKQLTVAQSSELLKQIGLHYLGRIKNMGKASESDFKK